MELIWTTINQKKKKNQVSAKYQTLFRQLWSILCLLFPMESLQIILLLYNCFPDEKQWFRSYATLFFLTLPQIYFHQHRKKIKNSTRKNFFYQLILTITCALKVLEQLIIKTIVVQVSLFFFFWALFNNMLNWFKTSSTFTIVVAKKDSFQTLFFFFFFYFLYILTKMSLQLVLNVSCLSTSFFLEFDLPSLGCYTMCTFILIAELKWI